MMMMRAFGAFCLLAAMLCSVNVEAASGRTMLQQINFQARNFTSHILQLHSHLQFQARVEQLLVQCQVSASTALTSPHPRAYVFSPFKRRRELAAAMSLQANLQTCARFPRTVA
jgi:hypothetical protein